jgi:anti-anti-sigma factor
MASHITSASAGIVQVVCLHGEFDVSTTAPLTTALETAARGTRPFTVVDLGDAAFVDCATLRVLETEARRHSALGGRLALASPHGTVVRVLDLAELPVGCDVFATTTQAVTVLEQARRHSRPTSETASTA